MNSASMKRGTRWLIEIVVVVAAAFVLVWCAGMKVTVVGNSMESGLPEGSHILVNRAAYLLGEPKPGDVVVFLPNGNEKSHYYVKRVVGVPGDTVQVTDGMLYVNGEPFDEQNTEAIRNAGLAGEGVTVEENTFFVLGDNRNSSEDSRYANIGNIKKEYITGKAWFIISPFRLIGRVK